METKSLYQRNNEEKLRTKDIISYCDNNFSHVPVDIVVHVVLEKVTSLGILSPLILIVHSITMYKYAEIPTLIYAFTFN